MRSKYGIQRPYLTTAEITYGRVYFRLSITKSYGVRGPCASTTMGTRLVYVGRRETIAIIDYLAWGRCYATRTYGNN